MRRKTQAICGTAKELLFHRPELFLTVSASVTEVIAASATPMGNGGAEDLNLPERSVFKRYASETFDQNLIDWFGSIHTEFDLIF